jgi:TRAP-type C4-dicarboxylate transport system permease small subunit
LRDASEDPARGAPSGPPPSRFSPGHDALFPGRLGDWAGRALGTVAALVLFAMMVLTFVDVTGRKLFTRPVYGAYEITEFLMGMLIFCALPLVTVREGHVTIDVFDHVVPAGLARWQRVIVSVVSSAALAFVAWRLWVLSASHMRTHEVTMTLHIPHGPFSRLFAVMAALAALSSLVILWGYLTGARPVRSGATGSAS